MMHDEISEETGEQRCRVCHRPFQTDEETLFCAECGSVYHLCCWENEDARCICSAPGDSPRPSLEQPELTVYAHEARVAVPLTENMPLRAAEDVAAEFAPKPTPAGNVLTVIASVAAIVALSVVPGMLNSDARLLGVGVVAAFLGAIVGMTAAMINWARRRLSLISIAAVIVCCAVIIATAFAGHRVVELFEQTHIGIMALDSTPPTDEQLAELAAPIANALRANVLIHHQSFLANAYGAGIVTHVADGKVYILTNKHVVNSDQLTVHFQNGLSAKGRREWLAPDNIDLAFIICETQPGANYQSVPVYKGLAGRPGDFSFAIGNPMRLPWSYTTGVISSIRMYRSNGHALRVYQTQTAINMGNSGGGLYDEDGGLIGVNTWTHDKAIAEGISFSISTKSLLEVLGMEKAERYIGRIMEEERKTNREQQAS